MTLDEILTDAEEVAMDVEKKLTQKTEAIDTVFVRMLKAKTKILYDLASDGGDKIASSDRDKITKVYKRLRTAQK